MTDGWVEAHHSTVWSRFEKKPFPTERDKRMRVELQRPNISGTPLAFPSPLSIGFYKIRGLARRPLTIPSSCHISMEVSPPSLVESVYDEFLS